MMHASFADADLLVAPIGLGPVTGAVPDRADADAYRLDSRDHPPESSPLAWPNSPRRRLSSMSVGPARWRTASRSVMDWLAAQGFGVAALEAIEPGDDALGMSLRLADRRRIFVKVWPSTIDLPALVAQLHLQHWMAQRGFAAPAVLRGATPIDAGVAVVMGYNRSGVPADAGIAAVRRAMAAGLARFVRLAEPYRARLPGLPWRQLPPVPARWPKSHHECFDVAADWIDDVALEALNVMRDASGPPIVGHLNWRAGAMRIGPASIAVLYGWDAVHLTPETLLVGEAAAGFMRDRVPDVSLSSVTPTPAQVAQFIDDYQQARGAEFNSRERREIAAAVNYARACHARGEHALDPFGCAAPGSARDSLQRFGTYRA